MGSYAGYLLETLLTLVVVCGAAFAVLFGARKLGMGRASGPITLAGQLPLEGRRAIYLVRVGAQVFILGASEAGLTKLGEMPAADVPEGGPVPGGFAGALARVIERGKVEPAGAERPETENEEP